MHKLLINPAPSEIVSVLREMLQQVQGKARTRTLDASGVEVYLEEIARTPAGHLHGNGGEVANSYKFRAESTDVEIVWHTLRGLKSVGVQALRIPARNTAGGLCSYWRLNLSPRNAWALLYPERAKQLDECLKTLSRRRLAAFGELEGPAALGSDDTYVLRDPKLGAIMRSRLKASRSAEAVVRNPRTGKREHIQIPFRYADTQSKAFQKAGGDLHTLLETVFLESGRLDLLDNVTPELIRACLESKKPIMRTAGIRHAHLLKAA